MNNPETLATQNKDKQRKNTQPTRQDWKHEQHTPNQTPVMNPGDGEG